MVKNKNIDYYFPFFYNKEKLIKKYVADQSYYFFFNLEKTKDEKIKKFYSNVICSTMEDCYDFFLEIVKDRRYINKFKYINYKKGKQFYKISALYHTIKFIFFNNSNNKINVNYIKEEMFNIFSFTKKEKEIFNKFFYINIKDEAEFEIEFAKYVFKYMINKNIDNKIKIAVIISFFYNSYEEFKKIYIKYLNLIKIDNSFSY